MLAEGYYSGTKGTILALFTFPWSKWVLFQIGFYKVELYEIAQMWLFLTYKKTIHIVQPRTSVIPSQNISFQTGKVFFNRN